VKALSSNPSTEKKKSGNAEIFIPMNCSGRIFFFLKGGMNFKISLPTKLMSYFSKDIEGGNE
jgi:hypothetical protein